jgi:4-amino-4-deoxy-L-arabinose transferase-like glycosyltransferase
MSDNALPPRRAALLLVLTAALLLLRLGDVPLVGPDEPRYARVAVEMHRAGEWARPTLQGAPWLEKPALYYWLAGGAFALLGETESAARLPSVGAALLLVGFTALVGARLYGRAAGLHAGFALGTSLLVFGYGRAAAMDMLLAATLSAGMGLVALRRLRIAGRLAIPAAYVCFALATLAKGPLGFLLPGLVVAADLAWTRDRRFLRELLSLPGLALFALVAGSWYVPILLDQGRAFVDVFLLNHNLERFTSTVHRHPGPFWYYAPVLAAGLFPWSGLLLPAAACARPRRDPADRFVLLWLVLPLLFFSAAGSKLPGYILPCLPPLALLMGRAAVRLADDPRALPPWARPRAVALVGLVLGTLFALGPLALWRRGDPGWASLMPAGLWALVVAWLVARALDRRADLGLSLMRIGAAGLLTLLALAAPPVVARLESGRDLFAPARGEEVLVWNAWRTAWMSGYFYNDGRVREVSGLPEIAAAVAERPRLVLCAPSERRRLERAPVFETQALAEGARGNTLLRVSLR